MENGSRFKRVELLDDIRGICVIYIVLFHISYDLVYIFGKNVPLFSSWFNQNVLQPSSAGLFILLAGIVSNYSKSNLARGIKVFGLGLLIWVGTVIIIPTSAIRFGVLSLLGSGMLLYYLLEKISPDFSDSSKRKVSPAVSIVILFLLFSITYQIQNGYLGFFKIPIVFLPDALYSTSFLFPLGFKNSSFQSSDYYPLIPWVFLFFIGANLGVYFKEDRMPKFFYKSRSKVLNVIGHNSLKIYLIHQPLAMAMLYFWFNILKR